MNKLIVILIVAVSLSCSNNKISDISDAVIEYELKRESGLSLKLITEVVVPESIFLRSSSDGKMFLVYGLDAKTKKRFVLNQFDLDLNLVKSYELPIGQGPGDISDPSSLFLDNDLLYAIEVGNRRISVFKLGNDLQLDRIEKFPESKWLLSPRISGDFSNIIYLRMEKPDSVLTPIYTAVYMSEFPSLKNETVVYVDQVGSFKADDLFSNDGKDIMDHQSLLDFFIKDENVFIVNMNDYSLIKYSIKAKTWHVKKIQYDKISMNNNLKIEFIKDMWGEKATKKYTLSDRILPISWAIPLKKGFVVLRRSDYWQASQNTMRAQYYDWDLNPLGNVDIPYFFRRNVLRATTVNEWALFIDSEQSFYLIVDTDSDWKIQKWRISE